MSNSLIFENITNPFFITSLLDEIYPQILWICLYITQYNGSIKPLYKKGEKHVEHEKALNIRMPKEMWLFLKNQSIDQEKSMNEIVLKRLENYKKNIEKRVDES